ncbi:TonB-dependent receptor [Kineobactrum salinum]|uniref:TonB-dependent receptor n=1 Tax=Kineobactrum salinum TaxID=2708301 RepID=A0A6C0U9P3_9GAMM|nr:TonB-dependent receptor [Kineobactrum salinum]QIB67395.1 TonB-dependent receptor [Kineobactrum salinum]
MPIAISTLTDDHLTVAAVTTVVDIQRLAPSLRIAEGTTGQLDFSIRGAFLGFGVDPSVVTYLDEVPAHSKVLRYSLYDLSSVEVLKGPQGTLFGRNSTGGAVLFSSKEPDVSGVEGFTRARYGNLNDRFLEGALNVPLSDTLATRLAGKLQRRDGTLKSVTQPGREYDNRHNGTVRASLLWSPSATIENQTIAGHYSMEENRVPNRALSLVGGCTGPTTPVTSCIFQPPFHEILGTDNLREWAEQEFDLRGTNKTVNINRNSDRVEQTFVTNKFTIDLGPVTLKNISHYGDLKVGFDRDFDGTPATVIEATIFDETESFYTENQLYGNALGDRLDWRVGITYSHDDARSNETQIIFPLPGSMTTPRRSISDTTFESTALFAQATYDLSAFMEGVSFTAGYRYTWDDREIATRAFAGASPQECALQVRPVPDSGPVAYPGTDLATCTRRLTLNSQEGTYSFTLDWQPSDHALLYATTRKGYKSGSFNTHAIDPTIAQYAPEIVTDVEVGLKADWELGSIPFRTNIAAYRNKYDNIQTSHTVVDNISGEVTAVTLNTDPITGLPNKATIKGYEVEMIVLPISWLQLSGFYSNIDAKYDQFFTISPRMDLAGENIAGLTPESYGISGQVDLPVSGPFETFLATASYFWREANQTNPASSSIVPERDYSSFDARVAMLNLFGSGIDIAVYGRNLGDNLSCSSNDIVGGLVTTRCSEGRTYGIELTHSFGG